MRRRCISPARLAFPESSTSTEKFFARDKLVPVGFDNHRERDVFVQREVDFFALRDRVPIEAAALCVAVLL